MKAPLVCRNIGAASDLLRTLGNPTRLAVACLLLDGPRSVMEMEAALGIGQPTLSQQLAALRSAGLIAGTRQARTTVYRIADDRVAPLVGVLRGMFPDLLPASALLTVGSDRAGLHRAAALARMAERDAM